MLAAAAEEHCMASEVARVGGEAEWLSGGEAGLWRSVRGQWPFALEPAWD